jgi:eukaryotic-like serine/threonine-protein kinase
MQGASSDGANRHTKLADRFLLKRRLGIGSFGIVYEAFDVRTQTTVALKQLTQLDPTSIARFKTEFRALADVSHENLITLHELFLCDGTWFFTMELVPGVDFFTHVRRSGAGNCDLLRLRPALAQLVEAVQACHQAGFIHRDIKPSNVLIRPNGRLVLLDFGLLAAANASGIQNTFHGSLTGTPAYMAPELFAGEPASHASDWYAVGMMLYEALAGTRAFQRDITEEMSRRHTPEWCLAGLSLAPKDLQRLCCDLLQVSPLDRPSTHAIFGALGLPHPDEEHAAFSGRERALAQFSHAFEAVKRGQRALVRLHGPSGIGKSRLVQTLLEPLREDPSTLVLEGRCREQESVPYKGFDAVIDQVVDLLAMQDEPLAAVDVETLAALSHVFSAFTRLPSLDGVPLDADDVIDRRERAFAGLRTLFLELSRRHTLVLFIDDLQWVDTDSLAVLEALFSHKDQSATLLLLSQRDDPSEASGLAGAMARLSPNFAESLDIALGPLTRAESESLIKTLVREVDGRQVDAICKESGGHPYFIWELAHTLRIDAGAISGTSLNALIGERVARLPALARDMLQLMATAGSPLGARVLRSWSGPESEVDPVTLLRRARLLKTVAGGSGDLVDVYHDRIREAVVQAMPATARVGTHRRLAEQLEAAGLGEPEELLLHWQACSELARARVYAELGGDRAMRVLAFDRAARLYRVALAMPTPGTISVPDAGALAPPPAPVAAAARGQLLRKLGDALLYAGHGAESARAYAASAEQLTGLAGVELQRLAAEQFLRSGQIQEGMQALRRVLDAVAIPMPKGGWQAIFSFLFSRLLLRLRGLKFRARSAEQLGALELAQIDVCWSVRTGLSLVDYVLHVAVQSRHLLLALRVGEPGRVARALIADAGLLGGNGYASLRRANQLLDAGAELAQSLGDRYLIASALLTRGANQMFLGRWRQALAHFAEVEVIFQRECRGVTWDISTTHLFSLVALRHVGDIAELRSRFQAYLRRAEQLSDLYASVTIALHLGTFLRLTDDDVDGAWQHLAETRARWPEGRFQVQHWLALCAELDILLYQNEPARALRLIEQQQRPLRSSFLDRVQTVRVEWMYRRGLVALQALAAGRRAQLSLARRMARGVSGEKAAWAVPFGKLLRAALASYAGERAAAVLLLQQASEDFERVDMPLHAVICRYRLGKWTGGEHSQALLASVTAAAAQRGIRNIERLANTYAPDLSQPRPYQR